MVRQGNRIRRVLWWFFLCLFLGTGAWLGIYALTAFTGEQEIRMMSQQLDAARARIAVTPEAADLATSDADSALPLKDSGFSDNTDDAAKPEVLPAVTNGGERALEQAAAGQTISTLQDKMDPLLATYRAFAAVNSDMFGWIQIEGTVVDYPVMHTPQEPQRYLHRDFDGRYSFAGLPFLDARCDNDSITQNRILYAHNMRSGQMFAQLLQYLDKDFAAQHPVINFDTLQERGAYEVFAVLQLELAPMSASSMFCYRMFDTRSQDEVDRLNRYLEQYARLHWGEVRVGDGILTLSTCQRLDSVDRLVVMARKAAPPLESASP